VERKLGFVKATETSEVPIGTLKMIKLEGKEILVANVDGKYYAIGNRCTHAGGDLSKGSLEGKTVTCPRHGSKFDVTTGKAISGPKILFFKPKILDETFYEVEVNDKDILVKIY
jgi:3-phenylpropionate/trans-cinnamate dioxygenase ferredoxin subunit